MKKVAVGFVGGGQLGRMLGSSSSPLDVICKSISEKNSSASKTCEVFSSDRDGINNFLNSIDVFTFESEHEGLELVEQVSNKDIAIYPPASFVEVAGDRYLEKSMLQSLSIPVAPFVLLANQMSEIELSTQLRELLTSGKLSTSGIVIKTRHGGYDGKGQWVLKSDQERDISLTAKEIVPLLSKPGCIVEGLVAFTIECSILATRSITGEIKQWPLTHNIHKDSILHLSYAPISEIPETLDIEGLEKQATEIVTMLCEENNYVGTIAVECFVTDKGLVVNEIAPRVHNSGHWTIEGSSTSQFEQHIRAITGLALGNTQIRGYCAMINLIGRDIDSQLLSEIDGAYLHWYDKEIRPGRKVGHITVVAEDEAGRKESVKKILSIMEEQSH